MRKKKPRFLIIIIFICVTAVLAGMNSGFSNRLVAFAGRYIGNPANKRIVEQSPQAVSVPDNPQNNKEENKVEDKIENNKYALENATYLNSQGKHMVKDPDDLLVLVNKSRELSPDWAPKDLVVPNVTFTFKDDSPRRYMRKDAALALEELFNQAKKDKIIIAATSGYRPYDMQKRIFENNAKVYGEKVANQTSAYPGQSEHQTGLAMDITSKSMNFQLEESFGNTVEGKWLKENAAKFGFIIRYPKDKVNITKYSYEPWHVRYVGKEVANTIMQKNITLEEYLNAVD